MSYDIQELLRGYSLGALQTIAKFLGLEMDSSDRVAYIQALSDMLSRQDVILSSLSRLDGLERLILKHILWQGGEVKADLLKQDLLQSGFILDSPSSAYQGSPYRQMPRYFEDILARLTALGLVFNSTATGYSGRPSTADLSSGSRLIIPEQLRPLLSSSLSRWIKSSSPEQIAVIQEAAPEAFQRDLFLFWSYINRHEVCLTSRGRIPKRHWMRINKDLWVKSEERDAHNEEDTGRLYFLRRLMEEMALLERVGSQLRTAAGSREFLRQSLRTRTERAFRAWLRMNSWNELLRIPELRLDLASNPDRRASSIIKGGRQYVTSLLKYIATEQWISLQDFLELAKTVNYEFLLPHYNNHYGIHNPYRSYNNPLAWEFPIYDETKGWDTVEARFIAYLLKEPLHWLGIVTLGWDSQGQLVAFRLSRLGAQVLGIIPPDAEPLPERRVIIQPNFEILALDPVSDYVLSILDEFAERVKSEHVFVYHLTQESVYQAQQRGMAVEEIIAFLDHESSTPMPQNVRLTLQEWGRYHERIVFFRGVSLCQVAEPSVLDYLLADPSCKTLLDHRISPTAALISDSKRLKDLVKALQSKGLLPTMTSPSDKQPSSLAVEPDGYIRFRHRVPDFHLLHQLAPFTEMREAGPFISKKSVSKAVNTGWTAERIIETLRLLCGKPPPPEIVSKIKVWGRYYGDAAMKKVTLLQLKNAEVLQELSRDPEVGPLIVPFSPPGALAIVRDEDVEALRQALMKKGIDLNAKFRLLE